MICGVDEAGRGPVIGPLVVAGVCVDDNGLEELIELGVRDSKMLTSDQRERLYKLIKGIAVCHTVKIDAEDLDVMMARDSLNLIEARCFAGVIERLQPYISYVDAADVSCKNFEQMIRKNTNFSPRLVVEHKADERYPVVSAASIVAKVERDLEIRLLQKLYGDFGSGYASDERTREFIERCYRENRSFPSCVRKRWRTAIRASNLRLEEFI